VAGVRCCACTCCRLVRSASPGCRECTCREVKRRGFTTGRREHLVHCASCAAAPLTRRRGLPGAAGCREPTGAADAGPHSDPSRADPQVGPHAGPQAGPNDGPTCTTRQMPRRSEGEKQQRREAAKAVPSMPRMLCSDEARRLLSIHVSVAHTWTPLCHSNQAGPSPLPRAGQSSSRRHLYVLSAARLVHLTGR
jgi:hypothetical protein